MLKRILSLVLSLVMVLSLLPVSNLVTAEGAEHVHCMCGEETTKDATCAECGTKAVVWTGIEKMPANNAPGNYYLTKDVAAAPAEYPSGDFAFCLNGHTLSSSNGKRIIGLTGANMSFTDCGTTGLITGATAATNPGSLMRFGSGSTFNLYGGKIAGNKGTGNGILSVADTATFNMYGGEISGNECGRGVVYVQDAGVTVRLLGGTITVNTGKNAAGGMAGGGGVYGMKGTVELGGTIRIYGNTCQDATKSADLYVRNDQGCKLQLSADKPLENGAKIYYGTWTAGSDANNYGVTVSAAPANWSSTWLRYNGTKLAISDTKLSLDTTPDHIHCMCGKEVADGKTCADCGTEAVEWTGTNAVPNTDGFYYLTETVTTDKVELKANVALCLHDKNLVSKSGDTILKTMPGYSMQLTACGSGMITGSTTAYPVEVQVNSAFTMWGGKISGNTYTGNGIVFIAQGTASLPGGNFTMYGGEISGNKVGRGTVFTAIPSNATNKLATVRLLGGVITGNEGLNSSTTTGGGAGVYALSPVEIGGTVQIYGNTAKVLTNDVYLRNDSVFTGSLVVSTEKPLEDGANVNYGLKTAEADTTNLKSITGTPANWSNQWVKLGEDKVGYKGGKFLIDNSNPAQHIHCMCGAEKALDATCASCGTKAILWTGTDKMPTKDEPGYYFLKSDVATGEINYANGGAFGICLNGYALKSEAGSQILEVFKGATMDLTDCGTTGTITGATGKTTFGSTMRVDKGAVLTLWNGHITGNTASDEGIIYVDGSDETSVAGGTFIMRGGKISGNKLRRGAVYGVSTGNPGPVIKILGGEITGNTGTGTGVRKGGAGVYSFYPVEIGGNAKIYGNTAAEGPADLYLRNDGTFTGKLIVSAQMPLTTGANVQYDLATADADETDLKFITGTPATWDKTWVTYAGDAVGYGDGKFYTKEPAPVLSNHIHCLCGAEKTLDATCASCGNKAVRWESTDKMPTNDQPGYYYLSGNTATTEIQYSGNKTFSICLNGHELKTSSGYKILQSSEGATVNFTDCADTMGTITGCTKATYGNTMRVNKGGVIALWNGHITGNTASDDGIIYVDGSADAAVAGGTFIMYGGKISGNTVRRGAVYGVSTGKNGPVIKILGGEITGNTGTGTGNRKGGAGVYSFFPVEIGGNAKIYGNTAAEGPADLYLRNDGSFTGKVIVSAEKPLVSGANIQYTLEVADPDPMQLSFITGTPTSWSMDWVSYDGKAVGYENGKFYTKKALAYADHDHDGKQWISVKQDNEQLPTAAGYYVLEESVKLEQLLVIGGDVHLCLNGHTLTAADNAAHFDVLNGGKLTICDCTAKTENGTYTAGKVTGGRGKTGGSVRVRSGGELRLESGIFTDNACAEGGNGGVVYADAGAKIHMTGGQMCGNNGAMGGAVRLGAPNVGGPFPTFIMEGGSICHNHSINLGGGVYAAGGADIQLLGGEIANNKADQGGGGIAVNSQGIDGKDLVTLPTTITLTGTTIRDNEATTWGGNVYIKTGTVLNMDGGIITGGKSKVGAGVLLESKDTTLNLTSGKINGNHAGAAGAGGVYASNNTIVNMTGGEICNNTTESGCGGIAVYAAKATFTGGSISGNDGTGMNIQGSEVLLGKVTISNNTALSSAGGVYISRAGSICADVTIDGAQIINNTCKTSGGGLFLYMNGNKVTMKSGKISGNTAGDGGGVVAQREVTFTMEGGEITNNKSTANCGGFYASIDSTFIMNGGKISNNYSSRNGGGLYCLRSTVQLNGGTISGNTAKNATGGVHINGSKVKLAGTTITGNKAETGSGGGVFVGPTTATIDGVKQTIKGSLVMTGGSISYNFTPKAGGGLLIQSQGTVVDMYGGSINNNTSTKFAGGVYVGKGATFNMHNGKVCYNKSENDVGGGIHHDGGAGNYTGGEIFGNSSPRSGGGLLVGGAGNVVNVKNVKIYDNTAKVAAGVILQGRATLNMEDCEIYNNEALQNGGGIYAYTYVTLNAKNCHIHDNVAGIDGAGLWSWATSYVNLESCLIENNEATKGQGGAIWTRGDGFNVTDCTIRSNTAAKQGGGFYAGWMGAATPRAIPGIYIVGSTFEKNVSGNQGGAMFISSGAELHMANSVFTENQAAAEAGAFWIKDEFTLDGLTVTGNTSGGEGYAVWIDDSDFDGESFFAGLMRFSGDIRVLDNKGGDLYLGEKVPIIIGEKGLGQNTEIRLVMHSGLLTDWVWGAYNYEGGEQVYTITCGERSLTDPELAEIEETQPDATEDTEPTQQTQATEQTQEGEDNTLLYAGIGGIAAVVVLAAVIAVILKKKSASKAKE